MGLFNGYLKPGPGVEKDAPKKKGIFLYFEILGRKFTKLVQLNMLHFLCSLPMILIYYLLFWPLCSSLTGWITHADSSIPAEALTHWQFSLSLLFTTLATIFLGTGPASAAAAYIQRCFTREEHAWIMSDFRDKLKENFKQSLIIAIADIIVLILSFVAINFYYHQTVHTSQSIWLVLLFVIVLFLLVYIFAHSYIYQLMITFENKTFATLKNAMLLSLSTMPYNIVAAIVITVLCYLVMSFINPIISLLLMFFLLIMFFRFPLEFHAARLIQKNILDKLCKEEKEDAESME